MNEFLDKFNAYPLGQKFIVVIMLALMIGAGFYFGVYDGLQSKIKQQQSQLQSVQQEKNKYEQLKKNRAEVVARLEKLKRQLLVAREKLPATAEVPSLLQRIHNQAKTAGLEISQFKRVSNSPKQYYIEIPVEMELVGTFDELANFFFYIGRMTRIVNVRDLQLKRTNNNLESDGNLKVKALATTFMYRANK
jgi:type IV pilus assembly protein PilO